MRKAIAILAGFLVLAFVNFGIYGRERLLGEGQVVLLRLAPVDPRSLMQGDYMALNFEAAGAAWDRTGREPPSDGRLVLALDKNGVGSFRRFDDGRPLAPGEVALRYRYRENRVRLATDSYFFEEGQGARFANAAYGEFRVGEDGDAILTGLRGPHLEPLGRRAVH